MDALLKTVEIGNSISYNHNLAIDHGSWWQLLERRFQLGEIA